MPYSCYQAVKEEELDRLLGIVVDVENLFMCVHKEEDSDTKQVSFDKTIWVVLGNVNIDHTNSMYVI